ncbi:MAG: prepilin-type cleavage/methylation domain-containing protein [Synechococcaceae cyanobacterium]|nr:prepilin-type cleavage/methylation domain-containing protein [Synechococcaceae cyanobacterium]
MSRRRPRRTAGFALAEVMLSVGIALALCTGMLQLVLQESRGSGRLARVLRERLWQRRTLDLVRDDLLRADAVRLNGNLASVCGLTGRRAVLQLANEQGVITYSLGAPPSPIWRGQVLMRCGPAFGLDGEPSSGAFQNRVVLDALAGGGFSVAADAAGLLRVRLRQVFRPPAEAEQSLESQRTLAGTPTEITPAR